MRENTVLKIGATVGIASAIAVIAAAQSRAETAYMNGIFNTNPGWSTIVGPNGEVCGTGCKQIRYNVFDLTPKSATKAAAEWMRAHPGADNTIVAYSMGSVGAYRALAEDTGFQGTVVLYGSPSKPNNGATYDEGGTPVLQTTTAKNVTFVSVQTDPVAFRTGGSTTPHISGYKNRNFQAETPTKVSEPSPVVEDREYAAPPKRTTWLTRLFTSRTSARASASAASADAQEPTGTRSSSRAETSSASWVSGRVTRVSTPTWSKRASERKSARTERRSARVSVDKD